MQIGAEVDLRLREMTPQDLAGAYALSRDAKWTHRLGDWELMLRVGEGLVAEHDGRIIGTIIGFAHGPEIATLGMVIVSREHRGAGIGRKLMDAMMARLAPRAIQLNATEDGLPLYKSQGYAPVGTIHQHQGAAFSQPMPKLRPQERVRPMGMTDAARIAELDRKASGLQRGPMFAELTRNAQGVVLDRDGEAVGFALFRRFGRGYVIGPVVAPDREGARTLISHWLGTHPGMFIRLDVPGDSGLTDWLEHLGLGGVDRVVTMVRGTAPQREGGAATFAIVSQALG
ncbi:MAG: family N-acetyltransferase [Phenylobacterium sp.]|nr:family N-acetyltransferase [Phenylobacterium sp.]